MANKIRSTYVNETLLIARRGWYMRHFHHVHSARTHTLIIKFRLDLIKERMRWRMEVEVAT